MRSNIAAALAVFAIASLVEALATSGSPPETSYKTEYYDDCPSTTATATATATGTVTSTYCFSCTKKPFGFGNSTIARITTTLTTYTTAFLDICPTGTVFKTYTITESCSSLNQPHPTNYVPQGFVITTVDCHVCAETPVPLVLTTPVAASPGLGGTPGENPAKVTGAPGSPAAPGAPGPPGHPGNPGTPDTHTPANPGNPGAPGTPVNPGLVATGETVSGAASPRIAASGASSLGAAIPSPNSPAAATPSGASPGAAFPGPNSPAAAAAPSGASPGGATPGAGSLGAASPGSATPDVAAPGVATPDVANPDVATPGVVTPGVATPGVATPGVATPGAASPGPASPSASPAPGSNDGIPNPGGFSPGNFKNLPAVGVAPSVPLLPKSQVLNGVQSTGDLSPSATNITPFPGAASTLSLGSSLFVGFIVMMGYLFWIL